ncbi:MAG: aldo/keto reductase [Solobacterium sp.]|nr:aldo/keto reductase [Solobacterium sp.]
MPVTPIEIELHNGIRIPLCGLDTIHLTPGTAYGGILDALERGILHIETAAEYGIETEIAKAIEDADLPRSKLFITDEIIGLKTAEATEKSAARSMKKLGIDYIDLLLMTWNGGSKEDDPKNKEVLAAWKGIEAMYKRGDARAIGIADFLPWQVEYLLQEIEIAPMVSLICIYPGHPDIDVLETYKEHRILPMAYLPRSIQNVIQSKEIGILSKKHGCRNEDIVLQYLVQKECVITTMRGENYEIRLVLSPEEMSFLDLMKDYSSSANPETDKD